MTDDICRKAARAGGRLWRARRSFGGYRPTDPRTVVWLIATRLAGGVSEPRQSLWEHGRRCAAGMDGDEANRLCWDQAKYLIGSEDRDPRCRSGQVCSESKRSAGDANRDGLIHERRGIDVELIRRGDGQGGVADAA